VEARSASTSSPAALRFGILGAARIAGKALIPAIEAAANAERVGVASRDPERARALLPGGRGYAGYSALLEDPDVDAVYVALPNGLHREWSERALAAGKHVLCEKPLALSAADAAAMAAAATRHRRLLMEAVMYRFHPRIRAVVAELRQKPPRASWMSFGFPLRRVGDIRLDAALGGGALLDVGTYTLSLARWIHGEPDWVRATARGEPVDMTISMTLGFPSGARAFCFASFETAEVQELRAGEVRLVRPFTAYRDPQDPYQLMVEAFSAAALGGLPAPLPLEDSIANLRVVDGIRRSLDSGGRHDLAEAGQGLPPAGEQLQG
jgi:D-xylose 1-dehydrogenase (NADP+, D-xylono-1,5-lactone-forming)